jgi:prophage tail gpP-like protein
MSETQHPQIVLKLGTTEWRGWSEISVERGIEQLCSSFSLVGLDRWPGGQRGVRTGAACTLSLDGQTVITGWVDGVGASLNANQSAIRITGRDKAADLVDCSVVGRSQWRNRSLAQIASDIAQPFGVVVRDEANTQPIRSVNVQEGESAFELIDRLAKHAGVLVVSDGQGGLRIIKQGAIGQRLGSIVEGQNLIEFSLDTDWRERFSQYIVKGQGTAADDQTDTATVGQLKAVETDLEVDRYRPLVVIAEEAGQALERRAAWEARVRRGRSSRGALRTNDWGPEAGKLWTPGDLVYIDSPSVGFTGWLLIAQVQYRLDARGGLSSQLSLVDEDAFAVEQNMRAGKIERALKGRNGADENRRGDLATRKGAGR